MGIDVKILSLSALCRASRDASLRHKAYKTLFTNVLQPYTAAFNIANIVFFNNKKILFRFMGELSPVPAKGINIVRFEHFKDDLEFLLGFITQEELGEAMGIKRSNINGYIKGLLKITKGFLKKFYTAWEERITEERAKVKHADPEYTPQNKKGPTMADLLTVLLRIEDKLDKHTGQAGQQNEKN